MALEAGLEVVGGEPPEAFYEALAEALAEICIANCKAGKYGEAGFRACGIGVIRQNREHEEAGEAQRAEAGAKADPGGQTEKGSGCSREPRRAGPMGTCREGGRATAVRVAAEAKTGRVQPTANSESHQPGA
jgi:hypothetical protein